MLTSNQIIQFLTENKTYLKKQFHCSEIGLFGSFARNQQTEQSDIDILVVYEPETPNLYDVERKLKDYLQSCFKREVDICAKKWIKPVFKPLVLKETIYA
jgi:predicted nucleotidyltransferase